jgi:hypothetical protein
VVEDLPDGKKMIKVSVVADMNNAQMQKVCAPIVGAPGAAFSPGPKEMEAEKAKIAKPFTGLMVDARTVGIKPCLYPEIHVAPSGEIYSSKIAEEQYVSKTGVAGWGKTMEPARSAARTGENPLKIKAVKMDGNKLLISQEDAMKVMASNSDTNYLKSGRVMIVVQ